MTHLLNAGVVLILDILLVAYSTGKDLKNHPSQILPYHHFILKRKKLRPTAINRCGEKLGIHKGHTESGPDLEPPAAAATKDASVVSDSVRPHRQEHCSGLPFPSPMHACMLSRFSCDPESNLHNSALLLCSVTFVGCGGGGGCPHWVQMRHP